MKVLKPQKASNYLDTERRKNMKVRAHMLVSGIVQGVFFRSQTKLKANHHQLTGWIRNLPDGRVEAVFEGEKEAIKALIEFCKHGPSGARVTDLDLTWETYTGEYDRFKIKYA